MLSFNVATSYGLHDIAMIGFPGVVVLAGLLLGERALFGFVFATIGVIFGIFVLETHGLVPDAFDHATDFSDVVNIALILLMTTLVLRLLLGNLSASLRLSRRQAEERRRLITELEAKNSELERFTYTVSHDLKTPLVTIGNFLGFLEQNAERGDLDRLRRDAAHLTQATDKMGRLLDDLLALSRTGFVVGSPRTVPFEELAREALSRVAGPIAERGVEVRLEPDLAEIHADPQRMVEVLQNLLENAVKFIGEQSEARIEIGRRPGDGGNVFFVRDNGSGSSRAITSGSSFSSTGWTRRSKAPASGWLWSNASSRPTRDASGWSPVAETKPGKLDLLLPALR